MEERGRGKRNMHSEKNKDERDRQLEARPKRNVTNISVRCEGREGCAGKKGSAGRSWRFWAPQQ